MGKCAPLQAWQPEQWRALTTKRNISLLTDELLRVTLNTFPSDLCSDWWLNKKNFIIYYSLFILMGIFLKHLWLIPNILQWQDCKILTKLVSSQTLPEAATRGVLLKKVFLKICEISRETLLKRACNFTKKKLQQRCFLAKFAKFLRTPILKNICKQVLLPFLGFRKLNHNIFPFTFKETSLFV